MPRTVRYECVVDRIIEDYVELCCTDPEGYVEVVQLHLTRFPEEMRDDIVPGSKIFWNRKEIEDEVESNG